MYHVPPHHRHNDHWQNMILLWIYSGCFVNVCNHVCVLDAGLALAESSKLWTSIPGSLQTGFCFLKHSSCTIKAVFVARPLCLQHHRFLFSIATIPAMTYCLIYATHHDSNPSERHVLIRCRLARDVTGSDSGSHVSYVYSVPWLMWKAKWLESGYRSVKDTVDS